MAIYQNNMYEMNDNSFVSKSIHFAAGTDELNKNWINVALFQYYMNLYPRSDISLGLGLTSNFFRFDSLTYFFQFRFFRFDSRFMHCSDIVHWKVWWGTSISRVLYCQYAPVPHHTLPKERLTPKHRFRRLSVLRGAEKRITTTTTCVLFACLFVFLCFAAISLVLA